MRLPSGLTDGSASAESDVGEEGRVGFRGFGWEAVPGVAGGLAMGVSRAG